MAMSNVYEAIKKLDSKEERTALRTFFTNNSEKRNEAKHVLPTCDDEEIVAYFKDLIKPGMFSLSRVIFANNTEYLCFSFLLLIVKSAQKKTHSCYRRATRC